MEHSRERSVIHIARLNASYHPVKIIEKFLEEADLQHNPKAFTITHFVAS